MTRINEVYMGILKTIILASGILGLQALGHTQNGKILHLSLQEALDIARDRSYQVRISNSAVRYAEGQNLESLSGFLPHVTIAENYIKSNDPVTVFSLKLKQGIFAQPDFNLSTLNSPDALVNFSTTFQVQQPVFNLDAIYGKSAASLGVKAKAASAQRVQETVSLQVRKAYFGVILARENVHAIGEAVQSARSHRDDARSAFEEGLTNQADYLAAEVRLSELEEQLITANYQVANASDALKFVMGLEEDGLIVLTDSLVSPEPVQPEVNLDDLQTVRSDLRAVALQVRAASRNLWMKRASWVPRLNAFGAVEWNASRAFKKDASNWAVGVQLRWNLFEGFGQFGRSKQARAQKEQADVQYRQATERARMEARKAQRAVQAAAARIKVARSAVEQAREALRIVEARFNQGLEKASDLLDKDVELTQAKLRYLQAKHDYNIARSELDYASGITHQKVEGSNR
ncbi:MAG: TolC family protein [bacterium]